jgi:hypothetical protein
MRLSLPRHPKRQPRLGLRGTRLGFQPAEERVEEAGVIDDDVEKVVVPTRLPSSLNEILPVVRR